MLLNRGYTSLSSNGGNDSCFGQRTTIAIKNLQRNKGLSIDGIVGKNTWKALYSK
ncbi:peptidoglycan-binding domain-containing protein [Clostridium sardiniense]|uniref:peptidoglycan-binding domain-containing protein n=1 Tax=Clostridium sardiniense TaxID=29369 RepID=UPI00311CDA90